MCEMAAPHISTIDESIVCGIGNLVKDTLEEVEGLSHGIVTLEVHVRDGRPVRAVVSRSRSLLLEGVKA